jgi:hypothetical protein
VGNYLAPASRADGDDTATATLPYGRGSDNGNGAKSEIRRPKPE